MMEWQNHAGSTLGPLKRLHHFAGTLFCRSFWLAAVCLFPVALTAASPADLARTFDDANRFYEQGKFADAATAYEGLLAAGHRSPAVYYNLGNAFFKSGQNGRAIAAYRHAQKLAPRDPNLRFNLSFVRKRISGEETERGTAWDRFLSRLTVNEWTLLAAAPYWALGLLLVARELWPAGRRPLRPYIGLAIIAAAGFGFCAAASNYSNLRVREAVVTVPNAILRRGPFEESPVSQQLPDGSELKVLDTTERNVGDQTQVWLQVQNERGTGWVQRDQVILLNPRAAAHPNQTAAGPAQTS